MNPTQDRPGPPNAFTREGTRMRRNTRGSKWVTPDAKYGKSGRRNPGKTVAFVTQQSTPAKANVESSRGRSDSATSCEQAVSPILQAAIHNASDLEILPVTQTRPPSVRFWSSLRSSLVDDEDISPETVTFRKVSYAPEASPLEPGCSADRETSELYSDTEELSAAKDRKESNATIFPGSGATIRKPEARQEELRSVQSPPNLAGFFRAAKDIYNVGPRSEGQKLWSSYTGLRKGKHIHTEVKKDFPEPMPTTRRPSEGLSYHPPTASLPPEKQREVRKQPSLAETLYPRKQSEFSRTSFEIPIRMDQHNQQYIDRSKPLPPAPLLQPAPKRRQQAYAEVELKPLPLTPRVRSISSSSSQANSDTVPRVPLVLMGKSQSANKSSTASAHPELVTNTAARPQHLEQLHPSLHSNKPKSKTPTTKPPSKPTHWWTHLVELTSEDYIPPSSSSKTQTAPLTTTISRPRPITALQEGRTVNLSSSCGGVGAPSAVTPLHLRSRQKGKQKVVSITPPSSPGGGHGNVNGSGSGSKHKNWLEKLGSPLEGIAGDDGGGKKSRYKDRKRDSDLSFMCAGVEEGNGIYGDVRDPGPSRQGGGKRDTRFYGPYERVLEEYEK